MKEKILTMHIFESPRILDSHQLMEKYYKIITYSKEEEEEKTANRFINLKNS